MSRRSQSYGTNRDYGKLARASQKSYAKADRTQRKNQYLSGKSGIVLMFAMIASFFGFFGRRNRT